MLGDVEETIYLVEDDDEEEEEIRVSAKPLKSFQKHISKDLSQTIKKQSEMLFVRGELQDQEQDATSRVLTRSQETLSCSYHPKHPAEATGFAG